MSSILRQAGQKFNMNDTHGNDNLTLEWIGPSEAAEMLETGQKVRNRALSQRTVEKYALAMLAGDWQVTGESIKFDKDGQLIDGQHRLSAIVQSGVTIQTVVVRGIEHAAFASMDQGRKRNTSDFLGIHGYANTAILAASAVRLIGYERKGNFRKLQSQEQPRNQEVLAFVQLHHAEIDQGIQIVRRVGFHGLAATPSLLAALFVLFVERDEEDAIGFFEALGSGAGLDEQHPILVLRNTLIQLKSGTRGVSQVDQNLVAALTIKAWNAWREGRSIGLLRFRAGGAKPEQFPEIV